MCPNGCQGILEEWHYDHMWYRRVGTWLHYMEKTYHYLSLASTFACTSFLRQFFRLRFHNECHRRA